MTASTNLVVLYEEWDCCCVSSSRCAVKMNLGNKALKGSWGATAANTSFASPASKDSNGGQSQPFFRPYVENMIDLIYSVQ